MQDVIIGCDHRGFELKEQIKEFLRTQKILFIDTGVKSSDRPNDNETPPLVTVTREVAETVQSAKNFCGILICSNGIGISIAANRFKGIRAALCKSPDVARAAREHNDANVLCLGNDVDFAIVQKIITTFMRTKFIPEARYKKRVELFDKIT